MAQQTDLGIASLRGVAAILVVVGHLVTVDAQGAIGSTDDSIWRLYALSFADVRMPLFTILSGFVYAYRPLPSLSRYGGLVKGKARRLLVPLLTVGTLVFLTQALVPGTTNKPPLEDYWRTFVFGYEFLWFLQAIFLIFLVVGLLDGLHLLETLRSWSVVFAVSCLLFVFVVIPPEWDVFSVSGALRLLPFFLLGYAANVFEWRPSKLVLWIAAAVFALLFSLRIAEILGAIPEPTLLFDRALSLAVGVVSCWLLVMVRRSIYASPLAWLGQFAFAIYLLHAFGSSGTRILLGRVGVTDQAVVFLACMAAALAFPILFRVTLGRVRWISWAILGERPQQTRTFPSRREARAIAAEARG